MNKQRRPRIRLALGRIIGWLSRRIRGLLCPAGRQNCFFDREEQRKFEMIAEAKRHWPNQLLDTSFKYRGDV